MSENVENVRKSNKRKIIYYILFSFLFVGLFLFLFIYLGGRLDKSLETLDESLETSNTLMIEEFNKVSDNIEEVSSNVREGEDRLDSLDQILISNTSEVQSLRDSLCLLNKEISYLNFKINSLVQWQTEQKQLNEHWGGKTLELLNWKLDLDEAAKLRELKKAEEIIIVVDSVPALVDTISSDIQKSKKNSGWFKRKD